MATLTGKTHSRHYRLFVDEVNLSGDARTLGRAGMSHSEDDITGWDEGIINFALGHPSAFLEGFQAVFNNTADASSHIELKAREEYLITLMIGIRAAPLVGDPAFSCPLEQKNYVADPGAEGPVLINADFVGPGQNHTLPTKVWGVVLEPGLISRVVTLTGASVDNGASSANGALGYLHLAVSSGGAWTLKIQDSPDDNAWNDLITFVSDGTTILAEQKSVAGTVDRWTRALFTRVAGNITAACTIVRL